MAISPNHLRDTMTTRREGPPVAATAAAAIEGVGRSLIAAATALSLAAVAAPIAVTATAAVNLLPGPPMAASLLVALLVLAPAGAGLLTALSGLRRIAKLVAQAGSEAELSVLRILVVALLFLYTLAAAAMTSGRGAAPDCVPIAAVALVAAWIWLLCLMLWPVAPPLRRHAATVLDIALLSAILHYGGGEVAGWYPLYILLTFYIGLRFGSAALAAGTAASILGFAAVVLTTDAWRLQPSLAAGLFFALAVLPACLAGTTRALAAARQSADAAEAGRQTTLRLIAGMLRAPAAGPGAARGAAPPIGDILDLAALEAGTFAPPVETFEPRALLRQILLPARDNGVALRWRVDARLPARLRGQARTFARIVSGIVEHASAQGAAVRIAVEPGGAIEQGHVRLVLRVDGLSADPEGGAAAQVPLALQLVERLVGLAGGTLAIDPAPGRRPRLTIGLPLAVEPSTQEPMLDLGRRVVLLATEDDELARALAEPLAVWNAEPSWPGDIAAALADLSRLRGANAPRPIAVIDGRDKLLSALSLAHAAARLGAAAPHVVLIAAETQIGSLGEVDEAGLDGFIPAPVTDELLANALEALPLEPARPAPAPAVPVAAPPVIPVAAPVEGAPRPAEPADPPPLAARVTPISVHPKFAPEGPPALDPRVIDGLRALGGGPGFAGEVIEAFRSEAQRLLARIEEAVALGDEALFTRGLVALRRAAGHVGGTRLGEVAASLQALTPAELRQQGAEHIRLLDAEIIRLAATLTEALPGAEAQRG